MKKKINKSKNYKWYSKVFYEEMLAGREIYNKDGEKLEFVEDEEYKQCYAPNEPVRMVLPYSWFVSNKTGNVIKVLKDRRLLWLKKWKNNSEYESYTFRHPKTGKCKNIMVHNLVALTWGSTRFGKVDALLSEKELYAFGVKSKEDNVNGHHKYKILDNPEKKYMPEYLELVTTKAHDIVDHVPDNDASPEKVREFIDNLNDLAKKEASGKIVVVISGSNNCIKSFDSFEELMQDEEFSFLSEWNFKLARVDIPVLVK